MVATNVTSLLGGCARRATRPRKTKRTGSLVSTESDEATPRDDRYGGGGTNGVYKNNFVRTAALTGRQCNMHRKGLVVLGRRLVLLCTCQGKTEGII